MRSGVLPLGGWIAPEAGLRLAALRKAPHRGPMPIPDFQALMGPVLAQLADGKSRGHADLVDALAAQFKLSDGELNLMLPSGRQRVFYNRIA